MKLIKQINNCGYWYVDSHLYYYNSVDSTCNKVFLDELSNNWSKKDVGPPIFRLNPSEYLFADHIDGKNVYQIVDDSNGCKKSIVPYDLQHQLYEKSYFIFSDFDEDRTLVYNKVLVQDNSHEVILRKQIGISPSKFFSTKDFLFYRDHGKKLTRGTPRNESPYGSVIVISDNNLNFLKKVDISEIAKGKNGANIFQLGEIDHFLGLIENRQLLLSGVCDQLISVNIETGEVEWIVDHKQVPAVMIEAGIRVLPGIRHNPLLDESNKKVYTLRGNFFCTIDLSRPTDIVIVDLVTQLEHFGIYSIRKGILHESKIYFLAAASVHEDFCRLMGIFDITKKEITSVFEVPMKESSLGLNPTFPVCYVDNKLFVKDNNGTLLIWA